MAVWIRSIFVLLTLSTPISSLLADSLIGWKFAKHPDGLCYIQRHKATFDHKYERGKEPFANYGPDAFFGIDCHEGHTAVGMNLVSRNSKYSLMICFFFKDERGKVVCRFLGAFNQRPAVEGNCEDPRLQHNIYRKHFYIGSGPDNDFVEYCADDLGAVTTCCRIRNGRVVPIHLSRNRQHNALYKVDVWDNRNNVWGGFSFGGHTMFYVYDVIEILTFDDPNPAKYPVTDIHSRIGFFFQGNGKTGHVTKPAIRNAYFGAIYDYVHTDHSQLEHVNEDKIGHAMGFKFVVEGNECFIVVDHIQSRTQRFKLEAPCFRDTPSSSPAPAHGMSIDWNSHEKIAQISACFFYLKSKNEPIFECFRFRTSKRSKPFWMTTWYYQPNACRDHLMNNPIKNVVFGSNMENHLSALDGLYVETATKTCQSYLLKNTLLYQEAVSARPKYAFGFDPLKNKKIERDSNGHLEGNRMDGVPADAPLFSLGGQRYFVKIDKNTWMHFEKGGPSKIERNWDYSFVTDYTMAMSLLSVDVVAALPATQPPTVPPPTTLAPTPPPTTTLPPTDPPTPPPTTTLAPTEPPTEPPTDPPTDPPTTTTAPTPPPTDPPTDPPTSTEPPTDAPSTEANVQTVSSAASAISATAPSNTGQHGSSGNSGNLAKQQPPCHYFYDSFEGMVTIWVIDFILLLLLVLVIIIDRKGANRQKLAKKKQNHEATETATTTFMTQQDVTVIPATVSSKRHKKGKKGKGKNKK